MAQARTFLLMGSGEFEPWSAEIERAALDGRTGPVAVLPTASSTEGDTVFNRWGRMGLDHYASMAVEARVLSVRTREDAEDEANARALDDASMIFSRAASPRTWPPRSWERSYGPRCRLLSTGVPCTQRAAPAR